jgi:hypothetical protein
MSGHTCFHCKLWIEEDAAHDCWTTTEAALTRELSEDLQEAWERLRDTAAAFGAQRIYASHHCIMFSRKACYFFVRPKRHVLEICIFLDRALKGPQVRRTERASRVKVANLLHIRHRDEVEPPVTDWLKEAYDVSNTLSGRSATSPKRLRPPDGAAASTSKPGRRKSPKRRRFG